MKAGTLTAVHAWNTKVLDEQENRMPGQIGDATRAIDTSIPIKAQLLRTSVETDCNTHALE